MVVWEPAERGVSPVVGVALLVAIVVALSVLAMTAFTGVSESALDSSAVHGTGSYDFDVSESDDHLHVRPESVDSRSTTFHLTVNGKDVHQWDGTSGVELSCLYPGDEVTITTEKDETTNLLTQHRLERPLGCDLNILERFTFVVLHTDSGEEKIRLRSDWDFGLAIDPDGPGWDDPHGNPTYTDDVGPISLSNPFHYSEMYEQEIEGLGGPDTPVWVFVMADNVHWKTSDAYVDRNWTDAPPDGETPGEGTYEINGNDLNPTPDQGEGEPTNDVYMVFEPGCDQSRVKVVEDRAGYANQILMDGEVVVSNTNTEEGVLIPDAPGIPC